MNHADSLLIGDFPCDFYTVLKSMRQSVSYSLLDPKWSELSRALGLKEEVITKLRRSLHVEFKSLDDVVIEMLQIWRAALGDSATLMLLCNALRDCGLSDAADVLQNQFGRPTAASSAEAFDIPSLPPYYIQRTLSLKTKVNPELFKTKAPDVFILSGLERHQVTLIANGNFTDTSENQRKKVTVRFIHLEFEEDVKEIFKMSSVPVHWIERRSESYFWKSSTGSLELIQRFIENDEETRYSETEFVDSVFGEFNSTPISIADTPGMGKSLLLSSIAHQVKIKFPEIHVAFLVLREVMRNISEEQFPMQDVRKWMHSKMSCCHQENCNKNIELFLDGYDEIMPHQLSQADLLFHCFKTLGNLRFVVTTRLHMQNELQAALGVLSCSILPFNMDNQIQFLQQFWITNQQARDCDALMEFSSKLLNELKDKITDEEREIAGIPLLCSMIAEVYSDDAARCSRLGNKRRVEIHVDSIFSIFERLISKKLHQNARLQNSVSKYLKHNIFLYHIYAAFNLIFLEPKSVGSKKHGSVSLAHIYAVGILEYNPLSSTPRFVHRTFAEFLVAEFFVKDLDDLFVTLALDTEEVKDAWIGLTYYAFKYPVISYFINGQLNIMDSSFDYAKLSEVLRKNNYAYEILSASTHANLPHCFDLVLKAAPETRLTTEEQITLMMLAVEYARCKDLLANILQLITTQQDWKVLPKKIVEETLKTAVLGGNYMFAEIFLNLLTSQNNDSELFFFLSSSLARSYLEIGQNRIDESCAVVKLVCSYNKKILEQRDGKDRTLLLQQDVHPKLLICLLELGADPNVISAGNKTVFGQLGGLEIYEKPKPFSMLDNCLLANDFTLLNTNNKRDVQERTPLFSLVEQVEVEDHVLESLQSKRVDLNEKDGNGDSVLFAAIMGRRSVQFIDRLINRYGCTLDKNNEGNSALHMAAKSGHLEAARYLVQASKCNINDQNGNGDTPLQVAISRSTSNRECKLVAKFLIHAGADPDVISAEEDTELCFCRLYWYKPEQFSELYDCLLAHGFTLFNQRDADERTPLSYVVEHVEVEDHVLESFQSKGVDFNARDKDGNSVLFAAIMGRRSARFIERLINRYGCTLDKNNKGDSALHMAAGWANLEAALYLVQANKCNINDQNREGDTPLHVALSRGILQSGCRPIAKFLIDAGADLDASDCDAGADLQ